MSRLSDRVDWTNWQQQFMASSEIYGSIFDPIIVEHGAHGTSNGTNASKQFVSVTCRM